ncbi:MAG TPA: MFS transporter, partial [Sphingomicrobium sp.]|nr:MFS transporter [Sphingomicrobium sp.]
GAVATAIGMTMWENGAQTTRDTLSGLLHGTASTMQALQSRGFTVEQSRQFVSQLVDSQAIAVTTINLFELFAAIFVGAAAIIWLAPKPAHAVDLGAGH